MTNFNQVWRIKLCSQVINLRFHMRSFPYTILWIAFTLAKWWTVEIWVDTFAFWTICLTRTSDQLSACSWYFWDSFPPWNPWISFLSPWEFLWRRNCLLWLCTGRPDSSLVYCSSGMFLHWPVLLEEDFLSSLVHRAKMTGSLIQDNSQPL